MFFTHLSRARALDARIEQLYMDIETQLKTHGLWKKACEDVQAHAPEWHQSPLVVHIERTLEAAQIVLDESGIDLRMVMALHDVGKVDQFIGFCSAGPDSPGYQLYQNHELQSAEIAAKLDFADEIQFLIRWHALAYSGIKPEKLIGRCDAEALVLKQNDGNHLLTELLLTFACDAFGKGWTPAQAEQRPQIALMVSHVCQAAEFEPWVEPLAHRLILSGVTQIG